MSEQNTQKKAIEKILELDPMLNLKAGSEIISEIFWAGIIYKLNRLNEGKDIKVSNESSGIEMPEQLNPVIAISNRDNYGGSLIY